ncbi:hypothetical protein KIPB_005252, partial [Kipferlia bialata]|eukprot:g5252.t1
MDEQKVQSMRQSRESQELEKKLAILNRPWKVEDLDHLLPTAGYVVVEPPAEYERKPPKEEAIHAGLEMLDNHGELAPANELLPNLKVGDQEVFGALLGKEREGAGKDEKKSREILELLLKVKNGTPSQRKAALRAIQNNALAFGVDALFTHILALLRSPTTEDIERHLLVKVIDRITFQLQYRLRPWTGRLLNAIEPMLIDRADPYARVEGRQIISNLSKAVGISTMMGALLPRVSSNTTESERESAALSIAVVASSLSVPVVMPFLKAICASEMVEARHTGMLIVRETARLLGLSSLPHLADLSSLAGPLLGQGESLNVRTMSARALCSLAESAYPYGFEAFEPLVEPLNRIFVRESSIKLRAAACRALGSIVPLMDDEKASLFLEGYLPEIRRIIAGDRSRSVRVDSFNRALLYALKQCLISPAMTQDTGRNMVKAFFTYFWSVRVVSDRRMSLELLDTTVELAAKTGPEFVVPIVGRFLKMEQPLRVLSYRVLEKVLSQYGAGNLDSRTASELLDGVLSAVHSHSGNEGEGWLMDCCGAVFVALGGDRVAPVSVMVCQEIEDLLQHGEPNLRTRGANLIIRAAETLGAAGDVARERLTGVYGALYEGLQEEFPDTLAALINAVNMLVRVLGVDNLRPPVEDLLPRLTPILRNVHDAVQEATIDLIGRLANLAPERASPKEWVRISFELLELFRARRKSTQRATVNAFGYIAKGLGPHDVLDTLLNNLRVQNRQLRVCSTVAIAVVADTCAPFTVLPYLMNEYLVPT